MKLKKLIPELASAIINAKYDIEPREIQELTIPKIKSGADLFVIAPEGSGKSTAINIGIIQQLKRAIDNAPRAIIIVSSKEKAFALDEQFEMLAKETSLRSLLVYDQGQLNYQKDMIYEGIDLLITTPRRLNELINASGVPLVNLKMLIVDDAETLFNNQNHTLLHRIVDAIDKLQVIMVADNWTNKFNALADRIMKNPAIVKIENKTI